MLPAAKDALILDMRTTRGSACGSRIAGRTSFTFFPSQAMRTDALAQFLVEKRWSRWFLLPGPHAAGRGLCGGRAPLGRPLRRPRRRRQKLRLQSRLAPQRHRLSADPNADAARDAGRLRLRRPLRRGRNAICSGIIFPTTPTTRVRSWARRGSLRSAWTPAFQSYSALQMQHRFKLFAHREHDRARLRRLARRQHRRQRGHARANDLAGRNARVPADRTTSSSPASRGRV